MFFEDKISWLKIKKAKNCSKFTCKAKALPWIWWEESVPVYKGEIFTEQPEDFFLFKDRERRKNMQSPQHRRMWSNCHSNESKEDIWQRIWNQIYGWLSNYNDQKVWHPKFNKQLVTAYEAIELPKAGFGFLGQKPGIYNSRVKEECWITHEAVKILLLLFIGNTWSKSLLGFEFFLKFKYIFNLYWILLI